MTSFIGNVSDVVDGYLCKRYQTIVSNFTDKANR